MSFPGMPRRLSDEELDRLRELGHEVRDIIASTGIPVEFQPDPAGQPAPTSGTHIVIDPYTPDLLCVYWDVEEDLVRRSLEASDAGDYTDPDLRVKVAANYAMGEAIRRILFEAGYKTGAGFDMEPSAIWVRRRRAAITGRQRLR